MAEGRWTLTVCERCGTDYETTRDPCPVCGIGPGVMEVEVFTEESLLRKLVGELTAAAGLAEDKDNLKWWWATNVILMKIAHLSGKSIKDVVVELYPAATPDAGGAANG